MRKPEKLDRFYDEVKEIHKKYACDWREGQFWFNILNEMAATGRDPFFPETDEMLKFIKNYFNVEDR